MATECMCLGLQIKNLENGSFRNRVCKCFANRVIFHAFLSSTDFFKINFFENFFQEYHQSVKQFGCRSGLCPNCLQMLLADDTSRQRVNEIYCKTLLL